MLPASDLAKFAGEYQNRESPGLRYTISCKGSQLFVQLTGQAVYEVSPEAEDTFFILLWRQKLYSLTMKVTRYRN